MVAVEVVVAVEESLPIIPQPLITSASIVRKQRHTAMILDPFLMYDIPFLSEKSGENIQTMSVVVNIIQASAYGPGMQVVLGGFIDDL